MAGDYGTAKFLSSIDNLGRQRDLVTKPRDCGCSIALSIRFSRCSSGRSKVGCEYQIADRPEPINGVLGVPEQLLFLGLCLRSVCRGEFLDSSADRKGFV